MPLPFRGQLFKGPLRALLESHRFASQFSSVQSSSQAGVVVAHEEIRVPDARPPNLQRNKIDEAISFYWDTKPPNDSQLAYADKFFLKHEPTLLFSAEKFRTVNFTTVPEVVFLGRSNVGKSSMLNAIMGREMCYTSSKPGKTRLMNGFAVGGQDPAGNPGRITVLDIPGYGHNSRESWGKEIMKYLVGRKQLMRTFVLVDCKHGIKRTDQELLALLRQNAIPHQVILSKADRILMGRAKQGEVIKLDENNITSLKNIVEDIRQQIQPGSDEGPGALGEILTCSTETRISSSGAERHKKLGVSSIRWAILAATGYGPGQNKILVDDSATLEESHATV